MEYLLLLNYQSPWAQFKLKNHVVIINMQAPQKHQKYVSRVLGLPMSKVVCKTKRIGGGFGGKETRSAFIAAAASVPSYLLNRPVKITLDRDTDMMISGQRHSFFGKYKVRKCNLLPILHRNLFFSCLVLFLRGCKERKEELTS